MVSEPDNRRCASEEAEPRWGGHEAVCQQRRWATKGVDWEVPHRSWRRVSTTPKRTISTSWIVVVRSSRLLLLKFIVGPLDAVFKSSYLFIYTS